jgi:transcription antitermination factor NusG
MMMDLPKERFADPEAVERKLAKTEAERDLEAWLRAAARDRRPDAIRGGPFWYLVAVRIGTEASTALKLLKDRQKAFCPRERVVEKNANGKGKRVVRRVMYPGYIFVQLAPGEVCWAGILTYEGVERLVPMNDRPARMAAAEMAVIRAVTRKRPHRKTKAPSLYVIGDRVMIKDGPFNWFHGEVVTPDDARGRLVVEVSMFGRPVDVTLELDQVERLR